MEIYYINEPFQISGQYMVWFYRLFFFFQWDKDKKDDQLLKMYVLLLTLKKEININNLEMFELEVTQMCIIFQKRTSDCKRQNKFDCMWHFLHFYMLFEQSIW